MIRRAERGATLQELLAAIEAQGGRARHIFPPDAAVVELPPGEPAEWGDDLAIYRGPIPQALVDPSVLPTRIASTIWNNRFAPLPRPPQDVIEGPRETLEERQPDARIFPFDRPQPPVAGPVNALSPLSPGYYDTSEFFMGSVAVGVFLMESNGSTYNWSDSEVTQTLNGIYAAMDWWINRGGAAAHLSFTYDLHIRQPTTYEPIQGPSSNDYLWVGEAMTGLGYFSYGIWQYLNDLRAARVTNWAYAIFVVDSSSSVNQGRFTDGAYAWGYPGGPWLVMSRYSSWAYNAANYYQAVPAHETGHIFYATDEYDDFGEVSGYLNAHDNDGASCLMNKNYLGNLCAASTLQIGWRDSDGDGIHDILDTNPETTLTPFSPDPTTQTVLGYTGTATVVALTNQNPYGSGNDITLQALTKVEFRVDASAWSQAIPDDGAFDGPVESFHFNTSSLTPGSHTVEARAVSSVGNLDPTPASDTVTVTAGAYTLNVSKTGSGTGTVTSSPAGINCGTDCSEPYASGTSVTLTATPASGSTFVGWSGDCSGTGSCVVSMSTARSVTATFSPILYTLTAAKAGSGTGTVTSSPAGIYCGTDCSEPYASGTSVTLTATPASGSTFAGWSGDCSGSGSCVVSMSAARSVTATFSTSISTFLQFVRAYFNGQDGISPMDRVESIVASSDGNQIYVAAYYSNAVLVLSRNPSTGALALLQVLQDGVGGVDGLAGTRALALSPDGRHLYVAGLLDSAIAVLARDPATGLLAPGQVVRDGVGGVDGLFWVATLTASPDGRHLYAASIVDRAVTAFTRDETSGTLAQIGMIRNGDPGVSGFDRPELLAISPDGNNLYLASSNDSALVVFRRDAAVGTLTLAQVLQDGVAGVDGLEGAFSVAVSPDGNHVYVAGKNENALSIFQRNPASGILSYLTILRDGVGGMEGLGGVSGLAFSRDGVYLYVAADLDTSLSLFECNVNSGGLTYRETHRRGVNGVQGLWGAQSVAASPDEGHIYVGSLFDSAIVHFSRPAPSATYTLAVSKNGSGSGKVTSYPAGISCGSDCSELLTAGAFVTLTAQPAPGSTFAGWSSGCSGTGNCTIVMTSAQTVTAAFSVSDVALQNDVALPDMMTATTRQGSWKYYWIDVASGSSNLVVDLYNLSADVDLYVQFGDKPTLGSYNCRPYAGGLAAEQCSFPAPAAGRWWIGVNNWDTGSITYTVRAKWSAPVFGGDLSFYTVTPCRVFDSQNSSALASEETRQIQITGICGIPSTAKAVSFNLTIVQPSSGGSLTLWPSGVTVNTSSINFPTGVTRANNAILALAANGQGTLSARPSLMNAGTVHLILDVNGYFQ